MNKKYFESIVCLTFTVIWMFLFVTSTFAMVYSASDYVSLYDFPQTISYYNSTGSIATQERTGYKFLYDFDDSIIRCQQEGGTCAYNPTYSQYCRVNTELPRFKVYVPPGTTNTNLTVYLNQDLDPKYVAVSRLGQPPTGDYSNYPAAQKFASLPYSGFTLSQLKANDCIGSNQAGIHSIAVGSTFVSNESDGGWLYVLLLPVQGFVKQIAFNNIISIDPYMLWFHQVDWASFGNIGSIVNPTPTPIPTPGCIFGCDNNSHCVNGQCVPNSPLPTPTPLKVGAEPGLVQVSLSADQVLELLINTTNSHADTPIYEWFLLTAIIGGNSFPVYVLTDKGLFDLKQVFADIYAYTFSFKADVTSIGELSMSDLGLQPGDTFVYGYAYQKMSGGIITDNVVIITVK
jgi:hypothetical protein